MYDPVVLQVRRTQVSGEGDVAIDLWEGADVTAPPGVANRSLSLLARWLVSAARKTAPVAESAPVEGSQNRLDVARGAKVGSDSR